LLEEDHSSSITEKIGTFHLDGKNNNDYNNINTATVKLTQDNRQGFRGFSLFPRRRLFPFLPAGLVHLVYGKAAAPFC